MRTRTFYDSEFKRQAIELAKTSDKPVSHIARDLGLKPVLLYNWIAKSKLDDKGNIVTDTEITQLRKKLAETELERDILKKPWLSSPNNRNEISIY